MICMHAHFTELLAKNMGHREMRPDCKSVHHWHSITYHLLIDGVKYHVTFHILHVPVVTPIKVFDLSSIANCKLITRL